MPQCMHGDGDTITREKEGAKWYILMMMVFPEETMPLNLIRELPKIDLSALREQYEGSASGGAAGSSSSSSSWDLLRGQVLRALEEYGCFEATYDKIFSPELYESVLKVIEEVFDLPLEAKRCFAVNPEKQPYHGYFGRPMLALYEGMGIIGVLDDDNPAIQNVADILWPNLGNPKFCDTLNTFARNVSELDLLVKRMVFEGLGVEKYLDSHVNCTNYSIGFNKYAAPNTEEAQVGVSSHTDKKFLTIIQQNRVDGLEVQAKDGGWVRATPSPSSFIVLVGESFLGWSNGRLHCPRHRVMVRGKETRYSIGLFSAVDGTIECPEELVDEQHPRLFKPFDEAGLMRFYRTEHGFKAESTIKAYCGVGVGIGGGV